MTHCFYSFMKKQKKEDSACNPKTCIKGPKGAHGRIGPVGKRGPNGPRVRES